MLMLFYELGWGQPSPKKELEQTGPPAFFNGIMDASAHTGAKAWCTLLKHTLDKYHIEEDCIWAADETGFQPGVGQKQRVIGPFVLMGAPSRQHVSTRARLFQLIGIRIIPLLCSVAHSDKGWTDGTIGQIIPKSSWTMQRNTTFTFSAILHIQPTYTKDLTS